MQSQVEKYRDIGVPGAKAGLSPYVYATNNPCAEGEVQAGRFVWRSATDPERFAKVSGIGQPLGFVERNIVYPNYTVMDEGTMVIADGENLTVAVKGDYYAASSTAATLNQKVFANLTDGGISTGAAGATVTGAVETTWVVKVGGAIGETIIISNWS
jgi:hypothetical protein